MNSVNFLKWERVSIISYKEYIFSAEHNLSISSYLVS